MIKKTWKRWLLSAVLAAVVMFADTLALAQVNKWYRPGHPPAWLVNCFYYFLAWPLAFTRLIFPRAAGDADEVWSWTMRQPALVRRKMSVKRPRGSPETPVRCQRPTAAT